jgi:hypothetical protein
MNQGTNSFAEPIILQMVQTKNQNEIYDILSWEIEITSYSFQGLLAVLNYL